MTSTTDPFAAQRSSEDAPIFRAEETNDAAVIDDLTNASPLPSPAGAQDRRQSREWDASKVPPSQFQKRRGSVYAVPGSRDAHVDNHKTRDQAFHAKLKEKGWWSSKGSS